MRTLPVVLAVLAVVIASCLNPRAASASIAPTTPTFQLKWGTPGWQQGQFSGPWGITADALGNVYVVDSGNNRVQKFDRLGNFITQWGWWGSGDGEFNGPTSVAVGPSGDVYVSDFYNSRIQRFTSTGAYIGQWGGFGAGNGQFNVPLGIAVDRSGNVYVADYGNHRVQKFNGSGSYLTQWGGQGNGNGQFNNPQGVGVSPGGDVYVTDFFNHRVQKFNNTGGYLTQWGTSGNGNGQFNGPSGVGVDAAGNVYVVDGSNRVQKFSAGGTYLTHWGSTGAADGQFIQAIDVAVDAAGNLYVPDYNTSRIQKFSGAGAAVSMAPAKFLLGWGALGSGNGQFWAAGAVATDATGNVFVADGYNNRVQKFSANGTYLTQWGVAGSGNGQFSYPNGVATDAASNVYVPDINGNRIQKFTNNGVYLMQWGVLGSGDGQLNSPQGVAIDAAGNLYVADSGNNRIQKFTSSGAYLTQWGSAGSGDGQFNFPYAIATDAVGNVYVVDSGNHRIQKFTATGAYLTQWGGQGSGNGQFDEPNGVAVDVSGNVYVADGINNRVQKFTANGTYLAKWGELGSGNHQFDYPMAVGTDAAGNIYVVDGNSLMRKFASPPSIALVSDIGNDQGKQVQVRVLRGSADSPGAGITITGYEVYRRNDPLPAGAIQSAEPMAAQLAGWTYVTSFPAHGESEYNVVAPTLANANASSLYYSALMVRAVTADPLTFHDSEIDNGFSVDNLSPPSPSQFMAMYSSGATHLSWGASVEPDFASFRLYRGSSADFVPGLASLVVETSETGYVDPGVAGSYYKVSAVDVNGNESVFALTGPNQTTDVPPAAPAVAFALDGTRPNPAIGGRLMVHFALPTAESATLELLDVAGRRVAQQMVGALGAGRHSVDLADGRRLEPGLYFVRLTQGANVRIVRTTILN